MRDALTDPFVQMGVLAVVVGCALVWFVLRRRGLAGRLVRQAAVWAVIFMAAFLVAGMWTDIRNTLTPRQSVAFDGASVTLPRALDGHYYMTLQINGAPVRFIVDTGATDIVLSRSAADAVGIDVDALVYTGQAFTANGVVRTASVRLDTVKLGGVVEHDLRAVINEGPMPESLLGMSFLQRFDRIEIAGGQMVLER